MEIESKLGLLNNDLDYDYCRDYKYLPDFVVYIGDEQYSISSEYYLDFDEDGDCDSRFEEVDYTKVGERALILGTPFLA